MSQAAPIDVFIAYAKADSELLERLRVQLSAAERIGLIDAWHDAEIEIGTDTQKAMEAAMNKAEIILLLISADFFASEVYDKELPLAMELHRAGKAKVLPIILRECTWQMTPIAGLKVLPPNGIPITSDHWSDPDHAFRLVVDEVIRLSSELRGTPLPTGTTTITTDRKEYTKTVIQHDNTDEKTATTDWKVWGLGLAALLVMAFLGFYFFDKEDIPASPEKQEELAQVSPEEKEKPIVSEVQKTEETRIQKPQRNSPIETQRKPAQQSPPATQEKETSLPPEYDKREEKSTPPAAPPKAYQLKNNTLTDLRDQKKYPVLSMNSLKWMGKNLAFQAAGSLCFGNVENNCQLYGRLYNFKLAQTACPDGWRLPTMAEWLGLSPQQINDLQLTLTGVYDGNNGWLMHQVTGFYWTGERSSAGEAKAFRISKSSSGKESRYTKWSLSCRCVLTE